MEFKVTADCTPAEARAFLGLPDLSPIHDRYVKAVLDSMDASTSVEQMEKLFRTLSPFGDAGLKMFSSMMDLGMSAAGGGTTRKE